MDKRRETLTEISSGLSEEEKAAMYHAINTKECHSPEISDEEEDGARKIKIVSLPWESERLKTLKVSLDEHWEKSITEKAKRMLLPRKRVPATGIVDPPSKLLKELPWTILQTNAHLE
jgi:hypothetical protein